ncbi:MAG: phage Gp37/Gp68 family protein [Pyrinomonadaceae bacterium]|nr:phage Gp37/Gp68 family protein [Pyrinomonadaceae bacterium]
MKQSKIEWTEATWNPSIGCDKISAGCKHCYAEVMAKRLQAMKSPDYENAFKFKIIPDRLETPLRVKKPTKFFVNSMSDLFHEEMPFEFLDKVFETIRKSPRHTYQILTKREKVLESYFQNRTVPDNVWLGVTVEIKSKKNRIDVLRDVDAKIRFLSVEPLLESLGKIDLTDIHWVIVGGESGHGARPMKPEWAIDIQEQCDEQDVSFFFKQWGAWGEDGQRRSKKANGRFLLGKEWNEEPSFEIAFA